MLYLFLLHFIWLIEQQNRSSRGRGTPSPYQRGRRSIRGRPQPIVWQDGKYKYTQMNLVVSIIRHIVQRQAYLIVKILFSIKS